MQPPSEWLAAGNMGAIIEKISAYDNAEGAIGYSVFYYVNNMYGNSRFKLLGIDGVKPTRDTIMRGEYPLEDYYYAVIRKDTPTDSPVRKLIDWLLTDDGQILSSRAGYIPLRPIEVDQNVEGMDPIYVGEVDFSSGTGGTEAMPKGSLNDVVVKGVRKPLSDIFYDGFNYIQYINSAIVNEINLHESPYLIDSYIEMEIKRSFSGIPNDYPNYELIDYGDGRTYIVINFPVGNPFFNGQESFSIPLTSDISPYGTWIDELDFSVKYNYDGDLSSWTKLFTLQAEESAAAAQELNSQAELLKQMVSYFKI